MKTFLSLTVSPYSAPAICQGAIENNQGGHYEIPKAIGSASYPPLPASQVGMIPPPYPIGYSIWPWELSTPSRAMLTNVFPCRHQRTRPALVNICAFSFFKF